MKLTESNIALSRPGDVLKDETIPGLSLRVFPRRKSFYLYYRTPEGAERRPKLGDLSDSFTLAKARKRAKEIKAAVAMGQDPSADRQRARKAPTVSDLADKYKKTILPELKPRTQKEYKRLIGKIIEPRLGAKRVEDLDYEAVFDFHRAQADHPFQANRSVAVLSVLLNYAERWGMRRAGSNPCSLVKRYREPGRKRYVRPDEAPAIQAALKAKQEKYPRAVAFLYLLMFTGARPAEVAAARKDQLDRVTVDVDGEPVTVGRVRLSEHKTDHTLDERVFYIPAHVLALLDTLETEDGTITGLKSAKHVWEEIRKDAGSPDLRMYDLRHTFASAALAARYSLEQVGQLLGHKNVATTKRYAHLMDEAALEAAHTTFGVLSGLLGPSSE